MELELVLHPDDAGKLPHLALIEASKAGRIQTRTTRYALQQANQALDDLRAGNFAGAAVLTP